MNKLSRCLTAAASVLLLAVFAFPLWRIDLIAPQYPEGLGMLVRVNTIAGLNPTDLTNINELNHYIGMQTIDPGSIPELRVLPWVFGALVVMGLVTALMARRGLLVAWLVAFVVVATAGLADFWWWGYRYGHHLDPHAIIKVPGMAYQPPLIGSKQLLNFTSVSWPALGGWAAFAAFGLGLAALVVARRAAPPSPAAGQTTRVRLTPSEAFTPAGVP